MACFIKCRRNPSNSPRLGGRASAFTLRSGAFMTTWTIILDHSQQHREAVWRIEFLELISLLLRIQVELSSRSLHRLNIFKSFDSGSTCTEIHELPNLTFVAVMTIGKTPAWRARMSVVWVTVAPQFRRKRFYNISHFHDRAMSFRTLAKGTFIVKHLFKISITALCIPVQCRYI